VQTLTEIVAAVVMHSSAVAYSQFGVTLEPHAMEKPVAAERTVARTIPPKKVVKVTARAAKTSDCPQQRALLVKA
jgi:hypothetical protein